MFCKPKSKNPEIVILKILRDYEVRVRFDLINESGIGANTADNVINSLILSGYIHVVPDLHKSKKTVKSYEQELQITADGIVFLYDYENTRRQQRNSNISLFISSFSLLISIAAVVVSILK